MEENDDFNEIKIVKLPIKIKLDDIDFLANQCISISYEVAKLNTDVLIIEGVIIISDAENRGKAIAHMWNRLGNNDFDVTAEKVWTLSKEMSETKDIKYYEIKINELSYFKVGEINDFSEETKSNVKQVNEIILKKAKK